MTVQNRLRYAVLQVLIPSHRFRYFRVIQNFIHKFRMTRVGGLGHLEPRPSGLRTPKFAYPASEPKPLQRMVANFGCSEARLAGFKWPGPPTLG